MKLYVITGLNLGWDCVVAVFPEYQYTKAQLLEVFPEDAFHFHIHEKELDFDLDGYR